MKATISIPDKLFRAADALAKRKGISRSKLYAKAVEEYLSRSKAIDITNQLNAFYKDENAPINIDLEWLQSGAVGREEW